MEETGFAYGRLISIASHEYKFGVMYFVSYILVVSLLYILGN